MNTRGLGGEIPDDQLAQYREACERKSARREIEALARDLARRPEEIADVYTQLYADLKAHARVADYVRVFAARQVRARFQPRDSDRVN